MISVTPQGSIYLCKTPLINDYKNQLTFSNLTSQLNYFNSRIQKTFDNYTYIKKDNVIKVGENIDTIIGCNYLFYRNNGFTNKYYFCFITNMEYINENCTAITIETDCFQTYQFDISYKPCFVEREHVNDDTIGANTIDENLNIGDIIADYETTLTEIGSQSWYWIVVAGNYEPTDNSRYAGIMSYAKYPQGNVWHAWEVNRNDPDTAINKVSTFIYDCCKAGRESFIQAMFVLPYQALTGVNETTHLVNDGVILDAERSWDKTTMASFSDYANVKNNKLFTYPYSFVRVTNNSGSYNDYKIEDFHETDIEYNPTNDMTFNIIGIPCQGYSGKIRPKNYKGILYNEDEAINLGKYPTLSWSGDSFTNWLTQNAINIGVDGISTAISGATKIASGNIAEGLTSTASNTASIIGSMVQASMQPNTAQGNANAGDVNFIFNLLRFKVMHMRAKREYLEIIDNYFSSYGYKCNKVKIPNITGRTNWNYVKTLECNFTGDNIPQTELNVIRTMFNNGVTLWHNSATMLDYSQSNAIV